MPGINLTLVGFVCGVCCPGDLPMEMGRHQGGMMIMNDTSMEVLMPLFVPLVDAVPKSLRQERNLGHHAVGNVAVYTSPVRMGANFSIDLNPEDIEHLQDLSGFSPKEIRHLYMRFRKLDRGRQGAVTAEDLGMIPELSTNPLGPRIVELLDEEHSGHIMFHQFLQRMSVFSGHAGREAKVAFMFRVWDVNGDGYITSEDLHETLKSMVGRKLPQATLDELVQRTLAAADLDGDGKITQHEFGLAMANSALGTTLQVPMVSSEDDTHTVTATPPPTPKPESGYVPADVSVAAKGAGPKLDLPSIPVAATAQGTPQVVPGRKA